MRLLTYIGSIRYTSLMATVSETIREAVRTCGHSRYAISKATGLTQATLSRFMQGMPMRSNNLDTLAEHLGLEIRPKGKARTRKKGR